MKYRENAFSQAIDNANFSDIKLIQGELYESKK